MCIGSLALKNQKKKKSGYKWNKSVFRKMIHILKTGCKNLQILEISHCKSRNSKTSLDKTWILRISKIFLFLNRDAGFPKYPITVKALIFAIFTSPI